MFSGKKAKFVTHGSFFDTFSKGRGVAENGISSNMVIKTVFKNVKP